MRQSRPSVGAIACPTLRFVDIDAAHLTSPAELFAERAIIAVARDFNQLESGFSATNHDPIVWLQAMKLTAIDYYRSARFSAGDHHFEDMVGGIDHRTNRQRVRTDR